MSDENGIKESRGDLLLWDRGNGDTRDLTATTVRGVRWTYMGSAISLIVQITYTAVISRILEPSHFGLVALAVLFAAFGNHFAQLGAGSAIVQKPSINSAEIRVAFTVSITLGLVFVALGWIAAPGLALIADTPGLVRVFRGIAVSFIFTGIGATAVALLRRDHRFKALAAAELGALCSSVVIGLVAAAAGFGVWSLVLAFISQQAVLSCVALVLVRHPMLPLLEWEVVKSVYGFGSRVSAIGFLEFLGLNSDTFAVGRFFTSDVLGQYTRATLVVGLPLQQAAASLTKVLLPGLSRIQEDRARLRQALLGGMAILTGILLPFWAVVSVLAHPVVKLLLGPGWALAATLIPLVGIAQAVEMTTRLSAVMAEAMGILRRKLVLQVVHLATIVCLVSLVLALGWGVLGLASAWATGELIRLLLYLRLMRNELQASYAAFARILGEACLLSAGVAFCAYVSHLGVFEGAPPIMQAGAGGLAGLVSYAVMLMVLPRSQIRQELARRHVIKLLFSRV